MNYYAHNLGDYAAATAHLTWDEDMAYTRLMRACYEAESGVQDGKQYRIARAATRAQKSAVDAVLSEFFQLDGGGIWRQKRIEEEIARFRDKRAKAARSANSRWTPDAMRSDSEGNADALPTQYDGNAPTHQQPITNTTNKDIAHSQDAKGQTPAERACVLMREAGCRSANASHPDLVAALQEGITPEMLRDTAVEGLATGGKANPFTWACATVRRRHARGATAVARAPAAKPQEPYKAERRDRSKQVEMPQQVSEIAEQLGIRRTAV